MGTKRLSVTLGSWAAATAALTHSTFVSAQPTTVTPLQDTFLGDQLQRVRPDFPDVGQGGDDVTARASAAIGEGNFKKALGILNAYSMPLNPAYRYLSGVASEELGDFNGARKHYQTATRQKRNFIQAEAALGVMEAKHGDRKAAQALLERLKTQRQACRSRCADQFAIERGVAALTAALN